ncbi:MAG: LacI family DNA-binding transcriptional regulator [Ilumatobacteraceae bacterium]
MARVTLQTIADRVGVSRMTVSNAFSRPDQLSSELRARILEAAAELGYVGPDPTARALARGTSGAVGVLLTDSLEYAFTDEVATGFLGAIASGLAPTGLALTLLTSSGSPDSNPARDVPMDGALVYSCHDESSAVDWLRRRKLPLVYVDQAPQAGIPSVNVDDRSGTRAAAQHIVDLGHRRIGIVTATFTGRHGVVADPLADATGHVARNRLLGWLEPLEAAGVQPTVYQHSDSADSVGYDGARELLRAANRPTAILCFSDAIAAGVVRGAESLGLRVPDDLSVVGFDDNPLAARMSPQLTTVRQDVDAKGRAAAAALTAAIEQSRAGTKVRARHHLLPTELVIRESTAPPP